jgi:hypothetical protein
MRDCPWFKFYISDVLLETAGMRDEEAGKWMRGAIKAWMNEDYSGYPMLERLALENRELSGIKARCGSLGGQARAKHMQAGAKQNVAKSSTVSISLSSLSSEKYEKKREQELEEGGVGGDGELPIPKVVTWRDSFEVFKAEAEAVFDRLYEDLEWIAEQKRYYPNLAVRKSMEKLWNQFWSKEEGWEYRKKNTKKGTKLNWQRTIENAFGNGRHRLYWGKGEVDDEQKQIDAARMERAAT